MASRACRFEQSGLEATGADARTMIATRRVHGPPTFDAFSTPCGRRCIPCLHGVWAHPERVRFRPRSSTAQGPLNLNNAEDKNPSPPQPQLHNSLQSTIETEHPDTQLATPYWSSSPVVPPCHIVSNADRRERSVDAQRTRRMSKSLLRRYSTAD